MLQREDLPSYKESQKQDDINNNCVGEIFHPFEIKVIMIKVYNNLKTEI